MSMFDIEFCESGHLTHYRGIMKKCVKFLVSETEEFYMDYPEFKFPSEGEITRYYRDIFIEKNEGAKIKLFQSKDFNDNESYMIWRYSE